MDKNITFKDILTYALLLALIVVVLLAMKQSDRQYGALVRIENLLGRQSSEVADLSRKIGRGGVTGGAESGNALETSPKGDPFHLVTAAETKPDFSRGDWLIENFGVKFNRLTPLGTTGDLYGTIVRARVQESLIYRDPATLKYLPLLARDWQVKDNSEAWNAYMKQAAEKGLKPEQIEKDPARPSAIEITFQLRKGVTFSDGHPFTADDVVFTFQWIMNPAVEAPRERAYVATNIGDVVKTNDYEVVYKFKEPYFEALELAGTLDVYPKHFYEKFGPQKFNQSPGLLLGTGPFRLPDPTAWTPGQALELVRNDRYWGVAPTFDKIIYREVEGDSAEMVLFKNGEVDRFSCQPDQYRELLKDTALLDRTQHFEFSAPDSGYTFVAWNQMRGGKPTLFADKRVRQAMTLLMDRKRLADELMLGYASVASGPFTPLAKQADPAIKPWPYDPARGKQLLKEVGFEDRDGDGVLENAEGVPFRFKLMYNAKNALSTRMALFMKDNFARASIAMDADPTDWTIMLKNMDSRNFDAITLGWSGGIESDIFQMFHSSMMKDAGDNYMSYSNPELDDLMKKARTTVDEEKRIPLWRQCHRILHEDQPYTFLLDRKGLVFIDKRIQNVGLSKLGLNYTQRYVQPIPWYVPRQAQKWK